MQSSNCLLLTNEDTDSCPALQLNPICQMPGSGAYGHGRYGVYAVLLCRLLLLSLVEEDTEKFQGDGLLSLWYEGGGITRFSIDGVLYEDGLGEAGGVGTQVFSDVGDTSSLATTGASGSGVLSISIVSPVPLFLLSIQLPN